MESIIFNSKFRKIKKKPKFKLDDTKSKEGVRAIPMIRQLKKVLTTHLAEQESLKSLIGDAWKNPDFIFTNECGEFIDPNLVSAWFRKTRNKASIKRKVTLHNVRHFYSSFLSSKSYFIVT